MTLDNEEDCSGDIALESGPPSTGSRDHREICDEDRDHQSMVPWSKAAVLAACIVFEGLYTCCLVPRLLSCNRIDMYISCIPDIHSGKEPTSHRHTRPDNCGMAMSNTLCTASRSDRDSGSIEFGLFSRLVPWIYFRLDPESQPRKKSGCVSVGRLV